MDTYILSLSSTLGKLELCEGVWGVFDTLDKAMIAAQKCIAAYDEIVYDWDWDEPVWLIFTNKSTWRIERLKMNDEPVV